MTLADESTSYADRRAALHDYFDRTAAETWERLTSDAPVSKIRATVRAGREQMGRLLLSWLPEDLTGRRILDAGCGTGTLSQALAARGADVVAIDIAPKLVAIANARADDVLDPSAAARIDWRSGDMLDPELGGFDHVVAMDSLIHYRQHDMADAIARLAERTGESMVITYAPRTRLLAAMHFAGTMFPKSDRSPRIEPVPPKRIAERLRERGLEPQRRERVAAGFYISEGLEVIAR
ncbi:MAG: magnesium protoporphyrin IX methyltransferase [Pseudomonadota bacterium]